MTARVGTFIARVMDAQAGVTREKHSILAYFELMHELTHQGFVDVSSEGLSISNVYYIEKNDGNLNDSVIENLQKVFGVAGSDPWAWAATMLKQECRLVIEEEEYNNQVRLRVKWTNHKDDEHSGIKVDSSDSARRDFANRFGSKLRARMGGTTVTPPAKAKPAAAPASETPPTAPPVAPKPPVPKSPATDPEEPSRIMAGCWGRFEAATHGMGDDARAAEFWRIVSEATGGITDNLTLADAQAAALALESYLSSPEELPF